MSNSTISSVTTSVSSLTSIATTQQNTPPPTSNNPPPEHSTSNVVTSVSTVSSVPPSTQVFTSVITKPPVDGTSSLPPETVVVTSVTTPTKGGGGAYTYSLSPSGTSSAGLAAGSKSSNNGGLSPGGKTAIAVVIPVVVVALLLIAILFAWRRRKQRKDEEEERKKEMEEYGYNPNHDPTLPAVAATDEIAEDTSGYRGWGAATAVGSVGRKTSTTVSGGAAAGGMARYSDGGYQSPTSLDHNSGDPLVGYRHEMDNEAVGALGAVPVAAHNRNADIHRGPSNASSSYSAGDHSNHSADAPIPVGSPQDYYMENPYYHPVPYENPYGAVMGGGQQQPIIQDNPARRNTRIQQAPYPHQGTSGIAQNF